MPIFSRGSTTDYKGWAFQQITSLLPARARSPPAKVLVELYEESLCPYCCNFVVNGLSKLFKDGLIDIVDLRLIPYGNAKASPDGRIVVCQHGELECTMNLVEGCAIKLFPNITQWFPFIACLSAVTPKLAIESHVPECAAGAGLDLKTLQECYTGPLGKKFERDFAAQTNSLSPPHQYVPWVVVNGQPAYEEYEAVEQLICAAYKGPKPAACSALKGRSRANKLLMHRSKVCVK